MAEYWDGPGRALENNHELEFRARIALVLIEKWGTVAGFIDGEDSAGRAKLGLQEPPALVERCFAIAEEFVRVAEAKRLLRQPSDSPAGLASMIGEIHGYQKTAEYAVAVESRSGSRHAEPPMTK